MNDALMIPVFMCNVGDYIILPGRKKKYRILDHTSTMTKSRPGSSSEYDDGRNYDNYAGSRLVDSSGKTFVVNSSIFVAQTTP